MEAQAETELITCIIVTPVVGADTGKVVLSAINAWSILIHSLTLPLEVPMGGKTKTGRVMGQVKREGEEITKQKKKKEKGDKGRG